MEQTFIMIKPDGVQKKVIGNIVSRFEQAGFTMTQAQLVHASEELAKKHYEEHRERVFFPELIDFLTSGPVFAMVWEGENIIQEARNMIGKTNPAEADPGTIRHDLAASKSENVIHGSDSPQSAIREIALWSQILS